MEVSDFSPVTDKIMCQNGIILSYKRKGAIFLCWIAESYSSLLLNICGRLKCPMFGILRINVFKIQSSLWEMVTRKNISILHL